MEISREQSIATIFARGLSRVRRSHARNGLATQHGIEPSDRSVNCEAEKRCGAEETVTEMNNEVQLET